MGEHARDLGQAPPPAAPAPVPDDLQQFYTRADAALAELSAWGQKIATEFHYDWGPMPAEGREGKA